MTDVEEGQQYANIASKDGRSSRKKDRTALKIVGILLSMPLIFFIVSFLIVLFTPPDNSEHLIELISGSYVVTGFYYREEGLVNSSYSSPDVGESMMFTFEKGGKFSIVHEEQHSVSRTTGMYSIKGITVEDINPDYRRFMPYIRQRPDARWYHINCYAGIAGLNVRLSLIELYVSYVDDDDILIYAPFSRLTWVVERR